MCLLKSAPREDKEGQGDGRVKTQGGDGRLRAKERGLRKASPAYTWVSDSWPPDWAGICLSPSLQCHRGDGAHYSPMSGVLGVTAADWAQTWLLRGSAGPSDAVVQTRDSGPTALQTPPPCTDLPGGVPA